MSCYFCLSADPKPETIRKALQTGNFYSSTGLLLKDIQRTETIWTITVDPAHAKGTTTRFIGFGGKTLQTVHGSVATFDLSKRTQGRYVRAVVNDEQGRKAWVQPLFFKIRWNHIGERGSNEKVYLFNQSDDLDGDYKDFRVELTSVLVDKKSNTFTQKRIVLLNNEKGF